ncbi:MAG: acetyl-CoA carboxylase biotin carboxyl carrier protein subunit [Pseudomonadota bacterium]|nr:acetyl-CoA carboxylase biotin carboxyl carrier protein subunit [Pseudomonadota bacterium]MEC8020150.1 acetyl-CoA carboxylase biotin carboxyl carrier protein subunit [Pseudomonadota bacterium]MEC8497980.1 acetyl-CoA carboxylase biotin carboxyl carrier protein subunit [Pseudomonadota bacterium]MEC8797864.1 acetyl-CoA carboxylase biotin carboxyl carrier protein subunit [Pseudomonadota bacterium]|tara:strand:- start:313 stop:522 length:210 start_codon:yes stop_codon:yes gene_type:complete
MKIKTEIQAVIWKINVKVGQKVDIGDTVVILESMKMEIPIESELRGIVKEILINEGDHVNENQELITLE